MPHKAGVLAQLPTLSEPERKNYTPFDQAYIASALYCLLVVPREVLDLPAHDHLFADLNRTDPLRWFQFLQEPAELRSNPAFHLIHLLRNSVAHALFTIDTSNNWAFWTDRKPLWRAAINRDSLTEFLSAAGQALADRCLQLKAGK
jgi:hypothetical protein